MGWDGAYHWTTKEIAIREILADYASNDEVQLIAHATARSGLWMVLRYDGKLMLAVDLLEKHDGHYMRKSLDEQSHPFSYDCPAHLVAMVPEPESDGIDNVDGILYPPGAIHMEKGDTWRSMWRKHQAAEIQRKLTAKALTVGATITLTNSWQVTITSLRPLLAKDSKGKVWRVSKRLLPTG